MKRKFINGLLLVAMAFASTSAFVSCKDYEEDNYASIMEGLADEAWVKDYVQSEINALHNVIDNELLNYTKYSDFKAFKDSVYLNVKSCACDLQPLKDTLVRHNERLAYLEGLVENMGTSNFNQATPFLVDGESWDLLKIVNELNRLSTEVAGLYKNEHIDSLEARIAALEGVEPYDDTEVKNRLDLLEKTILWGDSLKEAYQWAKYAQNRVKVDSARIDQLMDTLAKYTPLTQFQDSCAELRAYSDELYEKAFQLSYELYDKAMESLMNTNKVLNNRIDDVIRDNDAKFENINLQVSDLKEAYQEADSILQDQIDSLVKDVEELQEQLESLTTRVDQIEEAIKAQVTGILVQETYNPVVGSLVTPAGIKTNALLAFYGKAGKAFTFPSADIASETMDRNQLDADLQALGTISGSFSKIANQLLLGDEGNAGTMYVTVNPSSTNFVGKMITLENSQGEVAPVTLSELSTTSHVQTFGWTRAEGNGYYATKATISADDIKSGKTKVRADFSNSVGAVKNLYKNPSKSSIKSGLQDIAKDLIVNAGNILDANAVKASYTTNINGVEETHNVYSEYNVAVAAVTPLSFTTGEAINVKRLPGIDRVESLIGRMLDRVNVDGLINIGSLPELDLSNLQINISLDTAAIDNYEFHYNISVPAQSITVNGFHDGVPGTLQTYVAFNGYNIAYYPDEGGIYVDAEDGKHYSLGLGEPGTMCYWAIPADGGYTYKPQYNGIGYLTEDGDSIRFEIDDKIINVDGVDENIDIVVDLQSMIQEISDQISGSTAEVNAQLAELSNYINSVSDMIDEVRNINTKVEDLKNDMKDQIFSYIERANNVAVRYINQFSKIMQPVVFARTNNGVSRLSQSSSLPSHLKSGTVQLLPTTWNAEVVSPAFKKFVAVTKAIKNKANDPAEVNAVNSSNNLLKVIDPIAQQSVSINGLKKGYVYEILYEAVDYHGVIAARKYYVTVD